VQLPNTASRWELLDLTGRHRHGPDRLQLRTGNPYELSSIATCILVPASCPRPKVGRYPAQLCNDAASSAYELQLFG
jgi:hypothetical protein